MLYADPANSTVIHLYFSSGTCAISRTECFSQIHVARIPGRLKAFTGNEFGCVVDKGILYHPELFTLGEVTDLTRNQVFGVIQPWDFTTENKQRDAEAQRESCKDYENP